MKEIKLEEYILNNSMCITFWKRQKYRDRKQVSRCQGWGWKRGELQRDNKKELFGDDGTLLHLDCGGSYVIVSVKLIKLYI